MHMTLKKFVLISLLSTATMAAQAETTSQEGGRRFFVGALVGANFPTGNLGTNVSPIYGITAGAKIAPLFGVGFFGTYHGQTSTGSILNLNAGATTARFVLTGQADLYLSVFHVGINAGAEIHSWAIGAGPSVLGTTNTGFVFGPEAGFDIPLSPMVSVGAEVHYLLTTLQSAQGNMVAAANVKVWL